MPQNFQGSPALFENPNFQVVKKNGQLNTNQAEFPYGAKQAYFPLYFAKEK